VFGPEPRPAVREWSLEDFLKHHPAKFDGKTSLDAADQWLKDLERIYDAKMCPAENSLAFSVYMRTGEAEHWWINTKSILEERDEPVTWETFREIPLRVLPRQHSVRQGGVVPPVDPGREDRGRIC